MFRTKIVEKVETHILYSITFFPRKSCRLWDNVEKYGMAGQATDGNITRRMRIACWITKATDARSEYATLIAFPRQQWLRERSSVVRLHIIAFLLFNTFWKINLMHIICKGPVCTSQRTHKTPSSNVKLGGVCSNQQAVKYWSTAYVKYHCVLKDELFPWLMLSNRIGCFIYDKLDWLTIADLLIFTLCRRTDVLGTAKPATW
jgi:hypothetical protein